MEGKEVGVDSHSKSTDTDVEGEGRLVSIYETHPCAKLSSGGEAGF